jgi:hypothetical protein
MALKVDADLTDPPALSLSMDTIMNYGGYVLIAGTAFAALSVARATIEPIMEDLMTIVPGVQSQGGQQNEVLTV